MQCHDENASAIDRAGDDATDPPRQADQPAQRPPRKETGDAGGLVQDDAYGNRGGGRHLLPREKVSLGQQAPHDSAADDPSHAYDKMESPADEPPTAGAAAGRSYAGLRYETADVPETSQTQETGASSARSEDHAPSGRTGGAHESPAQRMRDAARGAESPVAPP